MNNPRIHMRPTPNYQEVKELLSSRLNIECDTDQIEYMLKSYPHLKTSLSYDGFDDHNAQKLQRIFARFKN